MNRTYFWMLCAQINLVGVWVVLEAVVPLVFLTVFALVLSAKVAWQR